MVSFQCNGCGDVVKKPKLDQHSGRCHGGFDCIDCSKTFGTPAEWKGHTSCISEAEKYQKSLYKGPTKDAKSSDPAPFNRGVQNSVRDFRNNQSFHGGGRGGGGGGWNAPPVRNSGTGANSKPLGAPSRMMPYVTAPVVPTPKPQPAVATPAPTNGSEKKRKREEDVAPSSPKKAKAEDTKKEKKKSKSDGDEKKKEKKAKDAAEVMEKDAKRKEKKLKDSNPAVEGDVEVKEKKSKKKKSEESEESSAATKEHKKKKKDKKKSEEV